MNQTIEYFRRADYGRGNKRVKNVMFCLLVKAMLPQADLALVRFKGVTQDSPIVIYQNRYWNLTTPNGQEDITKLDYDIGSMNYEISDINKVRPDMLQSRLDFFSANQVVKMFKTYPAGIQKARVLNGLQGAAHV